MEAGSLAVSPSLLFYLFADRLDVAGRPSQVGTSTGIVPCHDDLPVQKRALAVTLLASAFWGLREWGLIRLDVERKWLYISWHTYVKITLLRDGEAAGLEEQLVATMRRNPYEGPRTTHLREKSLQRLEDMGKLESADQMRKRAEEHQHRLEQRLYVERVVPHWFGGHFRDADKHVIDAVRDVAVTFGYIDSAETERLHFLGNSHTVATYRPNCDRIAGASGQFNETWARWRDFQRFEPELAKRLAEHCQRGVIRSVQGRGS